MRLSDWARQQGVHPKTAYRWWRAGTLPVPAYQVNARCIMVGEPTASPTPPLSSSVVLYARVSSHDQKADLDRQVSRMAQWATTNGLTVTAIVTEVGSGMNGTRPKIRKLLSDSTATTILVEHRDRLGRMNTELVESALASTGRRLVVIDTTEVDDDLVRDMTEVLTSFCARLYGKRSAANRAARAVAATQDAA